MFGVWCVVVVVEMDAVVAVVAARVPNITRVVVLVAACAVAVIGVVADAVGVDVVFCVIAAVLGDEYAVGDAMVY